MSDKNTTSTDKPNSSVSSSFGFAEVIALGMIWGFGFASVWLVSSNYHGDQSVSLENSIFCIMIAVVLVSGGMLFRDTIANAITHWAQKDRTQD